jgi:hypothetical protein
MLLKELQYQQAKRGWFSGIITACHAVDPGSIPGPRNIFYQPFRAMTPFCFCPPFSLWAKDVFCGMHPFFISFAFIFNFQFKTPSFHCNYPSPKNNSTFSRNIDPSTHHTIRTSFQNAHICNAASAGLCERLRHGWCSLERFLNTMTPSTALEGVILAVFQWDPL